MQKDEQPHPASVASLLDALSLVRELVRVETTRLEERQIAERVCRIMAAHHDFENCALFLVDGAALTCAASASRDTRLEETDGVADGVVRINHVSPTLDQGFLRLAARGQNALHIPNLDTLRVPGSHRAGSLICAPVRTDHALLGVVAVHHPERYHFVPWHERIVELCSDAIGQILLAGRLLARLERSVEQTTGALTSTQAQLQFETRQRMAAKAALQEGAKQLSYQASHDPLTGLCNRQELERQLQQIVDSSSRGTANHALCHIDLDQFKVINNTCGHLAGDALLIAIAELLKRQLCRKDTVARLGSDEFGVILRRCPATSAVRLTNDLRQSIETFRFVWKDRSFGVSVSIGVATITSTCASRAELFRAADSACHAAKDMGGNRVHLYRDDDHILTKRSRELQWVTAIDQALVEDRFSLVFQPIIPVGDVNLERWTRRMHYEVLLRLVEHDGNVIEPGAFFPVAERYGLAPRLDQWVVETFLRWLAKHPAHFDQLSLCAINLSGQSLNDETFLNLVADRLGRTSIPGERICFEITETTTITNVTAVASFMKQLKACGCRFALDDFGSGLSSFAYLKNLPVDFVKIDGMFIKDMVDDPVNLALVRSINGIGHEMGKKTIAEFVENEATMRGLRDIGVDYAQGFGIARPRPIVELEQAQPFREMGTDDALSRLGIRSP